MPSVDRALRPQLLDAYLRLDAFPDARAAVRGLRGRGLKTAILSNGSPRMLDAAVAAAGMAALFDGVFSVDSVRMYKPRPEVYALVTGSFGISPQQTVFVSSNRWDVMGAAAYGFRPIWVNRAHRPDEYPQHPAMQVAFDLSGLAALLP